MSARRVINVEREYVGTHQEVMSVYVRPGMYTSKYTSLEYWWYHHCMLDAFLSVCLSVPVVLKQVEGIRRCMFTYSLRLSESVVI